MEHLQTENFLNLGHIVHNQLEIRVIIQLVSRQTSGNIPAHPDCFIVQNGTVTAHFVRIFDLR